jgi:hypothetical protein
VGPRGGTTHIKIEPPILRNLHSFFLFGQQWANQIGFGPKFLHTLFMRANIPKASPMDNFGFKPVRTAEHQNNNKSRKHIKIKNKKDKSF